MIENEHQLMVAKYWVEHFTDSLNEIREIERSGKGDKFTKYQIESHKSQLDELVECVKQYEESHEKPN